MRIVKTIIVLSILVITASAAADPIIKHGEKTHEGVTGKISIFISQKEITVAESLMFTVEVLVPPSYSARMPAFEAYGFSTGFTERSQRFRVTNMSEVKTTHNPDGSEQLRQEFTLEPFLSGDYSILPLMIPFFKKSASKDADLTLPAFNVMTDGFRIKVLPLDDKQKSLADIYGQSDYRMEKLIKRERRKEDMSKEELKRKEDQQKEEKLALKKRRFPWWIVWTLLIVCALIPAVWFAGRKKVRALLARPKLPAHKIAFQALTALWRKNLPGNGMIKEFYYELSYILREYIGNRFGIRAINQTSEEFFQELLAKSPFEPATETLLREFCEHADTVKYSHFRPDVKAAEDSFKIVESFVETTKIEPGTPDNEK